MKWMLLYVMFAELMALAYVKERLEFIAIKDNKVKSRKWVEKHLSFALIQTAYLGVGLYLLITKRWEPAVILAGGLIISMFEVHRRLGVWSMRLDSLICLVIWYHMLLAL